MPDLLTHYAVNLLILRNSYSLKYTLVFSLVALLPDIDALFGVHRWFTHSIVVQLVAISVSIAVIAKLKPRYLQQTTVFAIALLLHIILDLSTASTPILWPIDTRSYQIKIDVVGSLVHGRLPEATPTIEITATPTDFSFRNRSEGSIATGSGIAIALAVAVSMLIQSYREKLCRK